MHSLLRFICKICHSQSTLYFHTQNCPSILLAPQSVQEIIYGIALLHFWLISFHVNCSSSLTFFSPSRSLYAYLTRRPRLWISFTYFYSIYGLSRYLMFILVCVVVSLWIDVFSRYVLISCYVSNVLLDHSGVWTWLARPSALMQPRALVGSEVFSVTSPTAWNNLPPSVLDISSTAASKLHLKLIFTLMPILVVLCFRILLFSVHPLTDLYCKRVMFWLYLVFVML